MKAIGITVLKPSGGLQGFAATWRQLEGGSAMVPRLAFGSLRELFSAITEKRLELLRFVAELVELGLLERDVDGHLSAPFDEIVIHGGIRDAA